MPVKKSKKPKKHIRPSWDEYFMELADAASKRATCDRGRSGCVIVRDKQVLVSGYVGSPMGMAHCDDVGHLLKRVTHDDGRETEHCVRTVHAEQNALVQAAKLGVALKNSTLYCRMTPCRTCAMLIINAGIEKVIAERRYPHAKESETMFKDAEVKLVHVHDETQEYE